MLVHTYEVYKKKKSFIMDSIFDCDFKKILIIDGKYICQLIFYIYLYSNFNADTENMNNGMGNSVGRGSNRPRGTSSRGRGTRHDFYNNSKFLFFFR